MILCRDLCTIRVKMVCKLFLFLVVNNCWLSHQSLVVSSSHLPNRHGLNGCQQSSYCLNGCLIISIVSCHLLLSVATDNSSTVVSSTVVLSQRSSHHQHRLVTSFCQWPASFCGLSVGRLLLLSLSSLSFHSSPPVVVTVSHLASLSFYSSPPVVVTVSHLASLSFHSSPPVVVVAFSCWHRSLLLSLHSSCLLLSSLSSLGWLSYTNNKTSAISGYTTRKDKRQESLLIAKDLPWPSCLLSSAH